MIDKDGKDRKGRRHNQPKKEGKIKIRVRWGGWEVSNEEKGKV